MRRNRMPGGFMGLPVIPSSVAASGVWTPNDAAYYAQQAGNALHWPTQQDPSFASVSLLCHCNTPRATALSPGIASSVGSAADLLVPNAFGSMKSGLTTAQAQWGTTSTYINGGANNGLLFVQGGSEFTFGSGDFTIEFWLRSTTPVSTNIFDPRTTGTQAVPLIYLDASIKLRYFVSGADRITGGTVVSQNAWHHIAISRVAGSTRLYLDGAQEGSTFTDSTTYVSIANWYFGCQVIGGTPGGGAQGYYQDIRITKGVGRYSGATLTLPTGPFPDY